MLRFGRSWVLWGCALALLVPAALGQQTTTNAPPVLQVEFTRLSELEAVPGTLALWEEHVVFGTREADGSVALRLQALSGDDAEVVTRISGPPGFVFDSMAFDGRYIGWSDNRTGKLQVFALDTESGSSWALTRTSSEQRQIRVAEGFAVWTSWGDFNIYAQDLATRTTYVVGGGGGIGAASGPDLNEGRVVWSQAQAGESFDLVLRAFPNGTLVQLTNDGLIQAAPRLWGHRVAWAEEALPTPSQKDLRSHGARIVALNLQNNRTLVVSPGFGPFIDPVLVDEWVAWRMLPGGALAVNLDSGATLTIASVDRILTDLAFSTDAMAFIVSDGDGMRVYGASLDDIGQAESMHIPVWIWIALAGLLALGFLYYRFRRA